MIQKIRWLMPLFAMVVLLFAFVPSARAQVVDETCQDAIDNDNDGLIDLTDPSCQELSEEPAVTVTPEPTAEPTPVTTEPATQAPTTTPTDLPDTGGDPDPDPGTGDTGEPPFNQWLAQTGIIGVAVSFLITVLSVAGITLSGQWKRIIALVGGIGAAILYAAIKADVETLSLEDVTATAIMVLASSQAAYLMIDGLLQGVAARARQ